MEEEYECQLNGCSFRAASFQAMEAHITAIHYRLFPYECQSCEEGLTTLLPTVSCVQVHVDFTHKSQRQIAFSRPPRFDELTVEIRDLANRFRIGGPISPSTTANPSPAGSTSAVSSPSYTAGGTTAVQSPAGPPPAHSAIPSPAGVAPYATASPAAPYTAPSPATPYAAPSPAASYAAPSPAAPFSATSPPTSTHSAASPAAFSASSPAAYPQPSPGVVTSPYGMQTSPGQEAAFSPAVSHSSPPASSATEEEDKAFLRQFFAPEGLLATTEETQESPSADTSAASARTPPDLDQDFQDVLKELMAEAPNHIAASANTSVASTSCVPWSVASFLEETNEMTQSVPMTQSNPMPATNLMPATNPMTTTNPMTATNPMTDNFMDMDGDLDADFNFAEEFGLPAGLLDAATGIDSSAFDVPLPFVTPKVEAPDPIPMTSDNPVPNDAWFLPANPPLTCATCHNLVESPVEHMAIAEGGAAAAVRGLICLGCGALISPAAWPQHAGTAQHCRQADWLVGREWAPALRQRSDLASSAGQELWTRLRAAFPSLSPLPSAEALLAAALAHVPELVGPSANHGCTVCEFVSPVERALARHVQLTGHYQAIVPPPTEGLTELSSGVAGVGVVRQTATPAQANATGMSLRLGQPGRPSFSYSVTKEKIVRPGTKASKQSKQAAQETSARTRPVTATWTPKPRPVKPAYPLKRTAPVVPGPTLTATRTPLPVYQPNAAQPQQRIYRLASRPQAAQINGQPCKVRLVSPAGSGRVVYLGAPGALRRLPVYAPRGPQPPPVRLNSRTLIPMQGQGLTG